MKHILRTCRITPAKGRPMNKLFVCFGLLLIIFSGCTVKKPTIPDWEVSLNLPLLKETYFIHDLVDSLNLVVSEDNVIHLNHSGDVSMAEFGNVALNPDFVSDILTIPSNIEVYGGINIVDEEYNYEIAYGEIAQGLVESYFTNIHPGVETIQVSFDELTNANGTPYKFYYTSSDEWLQHDLMNCRLGVEGSITTISEIHYRLLATSNQPDGSPVGQVQIRFNEPILFHVFEGRLSNYQLDMTENFSEIDLDYPLGIEEAVELTAASLDLHIESFVGFDCDLIGEIYAENYDSKTSVSIPLLDDNNQPFFINRANGEESTVTQYSISNGIESLMQIMPDRIELRNSYFILRDPPAGELGRVTSNADIRTTYTVDAPFTFILHNNRIIIRDPIEMKIAKVNRDQIREHAISAMLDMQVINKLPLGAQAILYIGIDSEIDPDDSTTYAFTKSIHLTSGAINPDYQIINDLALSQEELQIFTNEIVYMRWAFEFDESITPVTFTASPADYVEMKSLLRARIRTGGGEL